MANCGNCLFQGDRNTDQKGNNIVFCLVKCFWFSENSTCGHSRDYADLEKETRIKLASDVRQEDAEDRRLKKITRMNLRMMIVTFIVSFAFFWLTVKLFDKYIF